MMRCGGMRGVCHVCQATCLPLLLGGKKDAYKFGLCGKRTSVGDGLGIALGPLETTRAAGSGCVAMAESAMAAAERGEKRSLALAALVAAAVVGGLAGVISGALFTVAML